MIYVLTLTATRVNKKDGINPSMDMEMHQHNLASTTIGLFTDKDKALMAFEKYYHEENEVNGENTALKSYQRGNVLRATVVTIQTDEQGNEWGTMVTLNSMEANNDIDILDEVRANYI